MRRLILLIPLTLAGCRPDVQAACQDYFDAFDACALDYADSNGLDPADYEPAEHLCDAYAGTHDKASAELLSCYAEVYATADCATTEGWTQASQDVLACIPG